MPPTETYLRGQVRGQRGILPDGPRLSGLPAHLRVDRPIPCLAALPGRLSQPGQDRRQGRRIHANRGAIWPARSAPARCRPRPLSRMRASSSSGDSRASRTAPSSTTPAAPAATHPAATRGPIPPRTQTGRSVRAVIACRRMNAESLPTRPPASCPTAIRPSQPASSASSASATEHRLAQHPPTRGVGQSTGVPELFRRPEAVADDRDQILPRAINPILTNVIGMDADGVGLGPGNLASAGWLGP